MKSRSQKAERSCALVLLRSYALILFLLLAVGCVKNDNPIPRVPVDFRVYPNDVSYLNLNHNGGSEYVTGGVSGIVIYRINDDSFTAFDRACPYDWDEEDSWLWVENGIMLKCQKCESLFNILDGSVISGPAKFPLRQYFTRYDGMVLWVSSK